MTSRICLLLHVHQIFLIMLPSEFTTLEPFGVRGDRWGSDCQERLHSARTVDPKARETRYDVKLRITDAIYSLSSLEAHMQWHSLGH
jgi:hypothetical protein